MCKYLLCKYLSKLYTLLIKAVDIPYEALEHNLVLEVCQKCAKCLWSKLITDDDAGWAATLKVLVLIVVCLTTCESNDLGCNVCAKLLLAGAALDVYICSDLAVLKSDELKRNDVCSLMQ